MADKTIDQILEDYAAAHAVGCDSKPARDALLTAFIESLPDKYTDEALDRSGEYASEAEIAAKVAHNKCVDEAEAGVHALFGDKS